MTPYTTHEVLNQSTPLENINLYTADPLLQDCVLKSGGAWASAELEAFGALCGGEGYEWGKQANTVLPVLETHDRFGNRRDEVTFHPAWHSLMKASIGAGLHSRPWADDRPGRIVARTALYLLMDQVEQGHCCPVTMTTAAVPALRAEPEVAREWEPRLLSRAYDGRFLPADRKTGVTFGMAMTEKQGGSDVRTNTTRAEKTGDGYQLTGHKWFCSAPMSDAFLVLAQVSRKSKDSLTCFLVPRWKPDGSRNVFMIQRLKDKLGNRSNASGEVELADTWACRVGEEGRGVATIMKMVNQTRFDCIIGSTGIMRQALSQAIHHARHRSAFGKKLLEQPLMRNVLADLSLEVEAALQLAMRLSRAYESPREEEVLFRRLATAIGKYWVCKRAPAHVYEAMECLGGNGYTEECLMPRLYREAPVNAIWEGSGNVNALDMLRAMTGEPRTTERVLAEIAEGVSGNPVIGKILESIRGRLQRREESEARLLVEEMALGLQASILVRQSPDFVAEAFCATRLSGFAPTGSWGRCFGTLPGTVSQDALLSRGALLAKD